MFDVANKDSFKNVDWRHVQMRLNDILTVFLRWLLLGCVFIVPLWVITYGYSASGWRQFILAGLVILGWLAWLARAVISREVFIWQKTFAGWGLFVLVLAVLSVSAVADSGFGADGVFSGGGAWVWLAALGLGALIAQETRGRLAAAKGIALAYLAGSFVLALLVLGWRLAAGELVSFLEGGHSAQALWFSVSALLALGMGMASAKGLGVDFKSTPNDRAGGRERLVWLAALVGHLLVLALYDYSAAWSVLFGGAILWVIFGLFIDQWSASAFAARGKKTAAYALPFGVAIFSLLMMLAPVSALGPNLGTEGDKAGGVPTGISFTRFWKHGNPGLYAVGAGLGQGTAQFWSLAELVDMRSIRQWPGFTNNYAALLWDGGLALVAAFLFFGGLVLVRVFAKARSFFRKAAVREDYSAFYFVMALLLAWLGSFVVWGMSFGGSGLALFSIGVFYGLLASGFLAAERTKASVTAPAARELRLNVGVVAILARILLAAAIIGGIWFFASSVGVVQARLDFLRSIVTTPKNHPYPSFRPEAPRTPLAVDAVVKEGKVESSAGDESTGTEVDLEKLEKAVEAGGANSPYRLARLQLLSQALGEATATDAAAEAGRGQMLYLLRLLKQDLDAFDRDSLAGQAAWQIAFAAEKAGESAYLANSLGVDLKSTPSSEEAGKKQAAEWFRAARNYYETAIAALPRNVVLFTDVARFFRQRATLLATDGQPEPIYGLALNLADRAISLDGTYELAFLERSAILNAQGKTTEAAAALKSLAAGNATAAYRAANLEFSASNFEAAVGLYRQAIGLNQNHLQARYELVQAYIALNSKDEAEKEITALEELVPAADIETRLLLQGLRSLLGEE